jgi:MFS family permease
VAVGAMPFLLALMLQLGFGLNPLMSGLITFASAAASLVMKISARPILRLFGFKTVLIVNTVLVAVTLSACALFSARTPIIALIGLLLTFGFFRSLQYTALNTLTFADVAPADMSRASSLSSVAQQLAETISVSFSAVLLSISLNLAGTETPTVGDIAPIFGVLGFICLLPLPLFISMRRDAGAEISGRQAQPVSTD